jgi:adenylate cyclase, class 2
MTSGLEVELKAPCPRARGKVEALGAEFVKEEYQEDVYFSHPCRDFRKTDEALRLRMSDDLRITYKGQKQAGGLKAREEIEFPVPPEARAILERLGFREAFTIRKRRRTYRLDGLTVCCDDVAGLGEYVEVESSSTVDGGRIRSVLERLGVAEAATDRTYADLLSR